MEYSDRLLGVVAALGAEARALGPAVRRPDGLSCLGQETLLAISGMGAVRAGLAAHQLIDAGARRLVSFGLAGGLDPALSAGAVVLPTDVISARGARFSTSAPWREQLRAGLARPPASGFLLGSAAPIGSAADKAAIFRATGAIAVDMESLDVAAAAAAHGLPFIAVRVIVDTASDTLPSAVTSASRGGQVNLKRVLAGVAAAPWELIALIRLAQRYRAAIRSLEAVARAGLLPPPAAGMRVA